MVRVKSSQKSFTEQEVVNLTGICSEHLRGLAATRHLGSLETNGVTTPTWRFTTTDLSIMAVLHPRCDH